MQVQEVAAEGLKRQFRVTVPAAEIESRLTQRLQSIAKTVKVPGFRPGKAPLALLKRQYGRSVMGEILEQAVDEGSKKTIADSGLRPALQPKIEIESFDEGKDLAFAVNVEVLPEVPAVDLAGISLTRLLPEIEESRVDEAVDRLARSRQDFAAPETPRGAEKDDRVVIDFVGRIDGEPFEGGSGQDLTLALGAGQMVPGFEDQLIGAMPGEQRTVTVTFPESMPRDELRNREAVFDVTVKDLLGPKPYVIDDAWAKQIGADDLAGLRKSVRERLEADLKGVSRARMKRELLDQLAAAHHFEVPPGMVELEFEGIWKQLGEEMERSGQTFASEGETEDAARAEYRRIAERRVRLGLLLSDVGVKNGIRVEQQELQQAVLREAQRYPGQEKQVFEFYRANPGAIEQLRAPLFEDKVVDFMFELARVEERRVAIDELLREPDEETAPAIAAA